MQDVIQTLNGWLRRVPSWPLYILCMAPAPWLFWLGLTGGLGVEPIEVLEHEYGKLALQFLIAGLCVTPLRRFAGLNLLKFRRMLGLVSFAYLSFHLLVWLVLDVQSLSAVWQDILKRPYITVGMTSFVLLIPLALTSNALSLRRLGALAWRRLHWLVYPAVLLGGLHYIMQAKGLQIEPLFYMVLATALLILRLIPRGGLRRLRGQG